MTDDPQNAPQEPQELQMMMQLLPSEEVGVFADFASIWHTPNTFVLDFLATKQPPHPPIGPDGVPVPGAPVLEARVAARVRIPSEQVFPLIQALQAQGNIPEEETPMVSQAQSTITTAAVPVPSGAVYGSSQSGSTISQQTTVPPSHR